MKRFVAPLTSLAVVDPEGDRGCPKNGFDLRTRIAAVPILRTLAGVVATAGKRPHVVESPNNRNIQFADGGNACNAAVDPVEVDHIWPEALDQLPQVRAL